MTARRAAFRMKLRPGAETEYERRHREIWPEILDLLRSRGISEYAIFLDRESGTLFAFQKQSAAGGSQDLGREPVIQRWWAYMADLMETHPDNSPVSIPLEEVFFME